MPADTHALETPLHTAAAAATATPPRVQPPAVAAAAITAAARRLRRLAPGLALTAALAFVSIRLGETDWLRSSGIGALTVAIVLGMLVGNTVYPRLGVLPGAGVACARSTLLRLGIVLYGMRLTFQDIGAVGWTGAAIDAAVLCSTFGLACWLGCRVFGLDRKTAMLIGAGSSICGAAAVMAAEPVVRARAEQVMVAVATVVVFGTLGMFLYPVLYRLLGQYPALALSPTAYGVFAGSTIHEVAQVVVAGRAVGEQAANTAVIAKMVRVMMLAPFLVVLSAWLSRSAARGGAAAADADAGEQPGGIVIPWFALGFVMVAGFNSIVVLPPAVVAQVIDIDTGLLTMAMAGLGLTTHVSAIRKAGIKPLALAAVLFAWLVCGGFAINAGIAALLH